MGSTENNSSKNLNHKKFCRLCLQHNIILPRSFHECKFENCDCIKCSTIRLQRKIMSEQIKIRRSNQKQQKSNGTVVCAENDKSIIYWCQKCRNHGVQALKKCHKPCPFSNCSCSLCVLISARSKIETEVKRNCSINATKKPRRQNKNIKVNGETSQKTENPTCSSNTSFSPSNLQSTSTPSSNVPSSSNLTNQHSSELPILNTFHFPQQNFTPQRTFQLSSDPIDLSNISNLQNLNNPLPNHPFLNHPINSNFLTTPLFFNNLQMPSNSVVPIFFTFMPTSSQSL